MLKYKDNSIKTPDTGVDIKQPKAKCRINAKMQILTSILIMLN
jgi:hypothetical protein